jgi:hypothetical protein
MMTGMDDQRSAEGVEHLQAAARELLLAARSFLSVVEEVVEDRDRFAGAAAGVVDLLRDGLAGAMPPTSPLQPWEQAAWAGATMSDEDSSLDGDEAEDQPPDGERAAPATASTAAPAPPEEQAAAPAAGPPRRVRRIAVD